MNDQIIHEEDMGHGCVIRLVGDPDCDNNPMDYDTLGIMVCFHRHYALGHTGGRRRHPVDGVPDFEDIESFKLFLRETRPIHLPLYLYDHSGITMNTTGFSCPWDSGQVGVIYCPLDRARKEHNCKQVTPTIRRKVIKCLRAEVENYDAHISGECFGWVVMFEGKQVDSCWGYHGHNRVDWDYAIQCAKESAAAFLGNASIAAAI